MNTENETLLVDAQVTDQASEDQTKLRKNLKTSWLDSYQLGSGINAVTGEISLSALTPFTVKDEQNVYSSQNVNKIVNEEDFTQQVSITEKTAFNLSGAGLSQSLSYTKNINYSEITTTYVAYMSVDDINFANLDESKLAFNDKAKAMLDKKDYKGFREQYGDYFVASYKKGTFFTATLVCKASSSSEMEDFNNSVKTSYEKIFSAEGQTNFMTKAGEKNIDVNISIKMYGTQEDVPHFDVIADALKWFAANQKPVEQVALLYSYSQIDSNIPMIIDVPEQTFLDINQLYQKSFMVDAKYSNCPAPYKSRMTNEYKDFATTLTLEAPILANSPDQLSQLNKTCDKLLGKLNHIADCYTLYCNTMNARADEPDKGHHKDAGSSKTWSYGNNSTKSQISDVSFHSHEESKKLGYKIGHRSHTFKVENDDDLFITGWEVKSNRSDNGYWKKDDTYILGTGKCEIYVRSDYDRGLNYTVTCYYTDKSPYFEFTEVQ